jgi:hypothetical protein
MATNTLRRETDINLDHKVKKKKSSCNRKWMSNKSRVEE